MVAQVQQSSSSFRDHRSFWLWFGVLFLAALALIGIMFAVLGITAGASALLIAVSAALTAGLR